MTAQGLYATVIVRDPPNRTSSLRVKFYMGCKFLGAISGIKERRISCAGLATYLTSVSHMVDTGRKQNTVPEIKVKKNDHKHIY